MAAHFRRGLFGVRIQRAEAELFSRNGRNHAHFPKSKCIDVLAPITRILIALGRWLPVGDAAAIATLTSNSPFNSLLRLVLSVDIISRLIIDGTVTSSCVHGTMASPFISLFLCRDLFSSDCCKTLLPNASTGMKR